MQAIIVHTIKMGDVEDPEIFIAQPIYEWQQTEQGKWVMEHSTKPPVWYRSPDLYSYYHKYDIVAYLEGADLIYWKLKYE